MKLSCYSKKIHSLLSIILAVSAIFFPASAQAVTQKVSYYIGGDCSDYYDEKGEYAFFEDEEEWTCYLTVLVKPAKPVRTARLQYWNGRKWLQESSSKTASNGKAYLYFDPYCDEGYCDGTWKYRIYVDAVSGQKSDTSNSFEVSFYAGTVGDYDSAQY